MDQSKIVKKIKKIQTLATECLEDFDGDGGLSTAKKSIKKLAKKTTSQEKKDYIIDIVNKIKDCDEADKIEINILDKVTVGGRVLLPFYICHKYFMSYTLTTGDVDKITTELGVRVNQKNVAKNIKKTLFKYLTSNQVRKAGVPTPYKLNRNGLKHFESLLDS